MQSIQVSNELNQVSSQSPQHGVVAGVFAETEEMFSEKLQEDIGGDAWKMKTKQRARTSIEHFVPFSL